MWDRHSTHSACLLCASCFSFLSVFCSKGDCFCERLLFEADPGGGAIPNCRRSRLQQIVFCLFRSLACGARRVHPAASLSLHQQAIGRTTGRKTRRTESQRKTRLGSSAQRNHPRPSPQHIGLIHEYAGIQCAQFGIAPPGGLSIFG